MNQVRVGVGVIVKRGNKVLMGQRINSHGNETWSCPGGHLEFNESLIACGIREVVEETGLKVTDVREGPYTVDIFREDNKHYLTIFVICQSLHGDAKVLEPEKCVKWQWFEMGNLPSPQFLPNSNLIEKYGSLESVFERYYK